MVQTTVNLAALQPGRAQIAPYFDKLLPAFQEYCLNVSRRGMAMSIEACSYLWWLCDHVDARAVADFGSGFTSYTLRRYAATRDDVTVFSVDDNRNWLRASRQFLAAHDLPLTGAVWSETWTPRSGFDVIVYDFSGGEAREAGMRPVLDLGDIVLFDDAQNASHHRCMANAARDAGFVLLDVWHQTVDDFGRFDALAVKA